MGARKLSAVLADGTEIDGTLDAKNLITHLELRSGSQAFAADFDDYKDFQGYGVMFPTHIVQKIDGRIIADFTVSEALANPLPDFSAAGALAKAATP